MLVVRKTEEQINTISIGSLDPGAVCERNGEIIMKVEPCDYHQKPSCAGKRNPSCVVNLRTGKSWFIDGDQMVKPIKARCVVED